MKALIVEGGGFKSAFTAGVLDSFIANKYDPFDLYIGVSGGAMNLTSYISMQYKRNIDIISNISENTNFVSIIRFLKGGNYVELNYLHEVATKKYPFHQSSANNNLNSGDFKVVVTDYESGKPAYLSVKKYGWNDSIRATSTLPIAIRGYFEINNKKYIDGGLTDPLPAKQVYKWGYKDIVLLRTNPIDINPDWNIESLYAPYFYKDNAKIQKLISRNNIIYSNAQKYINAPPNTHTEEPRRSRFRDLWGLGIYGV